MSKGKGFGGGIKGVGGHATSNDSGGGERGSGGGGGGGGGGDLQSRINGSTSGVGLSRPLKHPSYTPRTPLLHF